MAGKRVSIKYLFFEVCTHDEKKGDCTYDLRKWIANIEKLSLEDRIKEVNGIEGRLEDIALVYESQFYVMNFMRLDVVSNTYILEANSKARHVDLDENEYIGKNTVVLYDYTKNILMIQSNRGSYGTAAIENYINSFLEEGLCYLRPINYEFSNTVGNKSYLKLDVRFANTKELTIKNSKSFEKIVSLCNEVNCMTAHVEFGLGYTRGTELEADTVQGIIEEIVDENNKRCISSARVTISDVQKSEIFDLMHNTLNMSIIFMVPPRGELAFETMAKRMADDYVEKKIRNRAINCLERG